MNVRTGWMATVVGIVISTALAAPAAGATAAPCTTATAGGDWPMYGHDLSNTRAQPAEHRLGPTAVTGITPAWTFSTASTGDDTGFDSTPVVADGCAFIGSAGGTIYAIDARTGHLVWHYKVDAPSPGLGGAIVGAGAVDGASIVFLVSENKAPYAIALNRWTGAVTWRSPAFAPPLDGTGSYTNASPVVANGLVFAGYSPPEGDATATGGFALIDAATGAIVTTTPTISPADQAKGYAGGGLWSTPAYDPSTEYAYIGAGNPGNKTQQDPDTDAILKIDLDRARPTFGQIVAAYAGNVDQYASALQALTQTPACQLSANPSVPDPLDDPVCGQLDLDFGSAANLFRTSRGRLVVGDLQKSGVYHVADATTMKPVWTSLVGASCQACNADSTAFDGNSVEGVGTPGGVAFSLARDTGSANWASPLGDGIHYQSVSVADGVTWTVDSLGNLDAIDTATGIPLAHRPMSADAGTALTDVTSSGVAIAEHEVIASAGGITGESGSGAGYLIAYRAG